MWKSTIDFTKAAVQGQKDDGQTWKYDFVTCWEDLPVCESTSHPHPHPGNGWRQAQHACACCRVSCNRLLVNAVHVMNTLLSCFMWLLPGTPHNLQLYN